MTTAELFTPYKLFFGILTSSALIFEEVKYSIQQKYGHCDHVFGPFDFEHTSYYRKEMGSGLKKWLISIETLQDFNDFYQSKIFSNLCENNHLTHDGKRLINIDPGSLTLHNVILLSTKNFYHRIPLHKGIYAELTLYFQHKKFHPLPWTYPDFKFDTYLNALYAIRYSLIKN